MANSVKTYPRNRDLTAGTGIAPHLVQLAESDPGEEADIGIRGALSTTDFAIKVDLKMVSASVNSEVFFLGGHDLEMVTIRELLKDRRVEHYDAGLHWGAKASAYAEALRIEAERGRTLVFVELELDIELPASADVVLIDHHGPLAGRDQPSALEQVARRIGIDSAEFAGNRWWQLVAANDRGHVRTMRSLDPPATDAEVRLVRQRDLMAQGVADDELAAARAQAAEATQLANGRLTVARCPTNRTGLVAEMMEPFFGGAGYENLLVIGHSQVGFYGQGSCVSRLAQLSPPAASWYGGSLPEYGFWGAKTDSLEFDPEQRLIEWLE